MTPRTRTNGARGYRVAAVCMLVPSLLAGCGSADKERAANNPWGENRLVPASLPERFGGPTIRDLPTDAFDGFAVVLDASSSAGSLGRLIVIAQPATPPETIQALTPAPAVTTMAGRDVWKLNTSDDSFEVIATNIDGCPELRVYGSGGAQLKDAEPIIAEGTCSQSNNGWTYRPKVPPIPGYEVTAVPANPLSGYITTAVGNMSTPPNRPSQLDIIVMQVDDPPSWNQQFPAPVIDRQTINSRATTRRDPTPLLRNDERTHNQEPSWLWTWIEDENTFVAVKVTNMSEPAASGLLKGLKSVPRSEWSAHSSTSG